MSEIKREMIEPRSHEDTKGLEPEPKTARSKAEPELRFAEFDAEWSNFKLSDISKFSKGKGISKADIDETGNTECIRYGQLYTEYGEVIDNVISRTKVSSENLVLSKKNDVIIPASGETSIDIATASCVQLDGIALGGDLNIIRTAQNGAFLAYYLNNKKKTDIAKFAQGNSVVHLYGTQLGLLSLNLPSNIEQQKIADFLSSVDKKIEQLIEKHRLLTEYKKGVMQQIFSQQIRFKDDNGNDYPEWEEKRLGELGSFKSGIGFSDAEQGGAEGIPFYKVSDMNLASNERIMSVANNYVSEEQITRLKFRVIGSPSIIFAKVGAAIFLERKRVATNFLIDNNMMAFTPNQDISFVRHLFSTLRLSKFAQVGALPSYNASDLKIIKVNLPCSEEQQKIANFLTEIDHKIDQAWSILEHTKAFKKGLLQKMFV